MPQGDLFPDQSYYFFQRKEFEKALALLEKFVAENGGEEKLEKQQFFSLFSLYGSLANCSLKLNRKEEAKKYYRKALTAAKDPRVRHIILIKLAEMLDAKKDLDEIARYVEEAHAGFQSQKSCYYLAEIRVRQGKTEEAKKYCSLAFSCRNVPRVEQKKLMELKKRLSE